MSNPGETNDPARIVADERAKARRVLDRMGKATEMHNPQLEQMARIRRANELDEMARLAANVERLRADNAALRAIAQAVAAEDATIAYNDARSTPNYCVLCDADYAWPQTDVTHTADCPVTQFRALLADTPDGH